MSFHILFFNIGNEDHKLKVYSGRHTLENLEQGTRIDYGSSGPVKKNLKDEGRVNPVNTNTSTPYKAKKKRAVVAEPLDLIHSVKEGVNEKDIAVPLRSTSVEKVKDKATVGYTPEKLNDKGKSIAVSFSPTSEKAISVDTPNSHLNEQEKDKVKSTDTLSNHPITKKIRRNVRAAISSCPPLTRSNRYLSFCYPVY